MARRKAGRGTTERIQLFISHVREISHNRGQYCERATPIRSMKTMFAAGLMRFSYFKEQHVTDALAANPFGFVTSDRLTERGKARLEKVK